MLKAFADQPTVELPPRADGKLDVAGAVGRRGRLSVVRDLGMREPYTGQVNLVSGEIAQDFAMYLAASEQQPALVALGVRFGAGAVLRSAGGIIVQPLPQCPESVIADVEARADKLSDISLQLDTLGGARAVVEHLLADLQPIFLGAQPLSWQCDCSRDRLERILGSLGADELEDMVRQQGGAQAHCHFCNQTYTFDAARLRELAARTGEEQ